MLGDRDYMRAEQFGGRNPRQGPSLIAIIIWMNVAVFLLQLLFEVWIVTPEDVARNPSHYPSGLRAPFQDGGVSREALMNFEIHRLVTYMFVHDSRNLLHLIGNMFLVYFAGKRVLSVLGPRHFLAIYLLGGILGALAQLAAGETYMIGASAGAFALLCAFATLMPEMELLMLLYFIIPLRLRAKYLALGLVAADVLLLLVNLKFNFSPIAHFAHLCGALVGWYYVRALGYGGRTVSLADLRKKRRARSRGAMPEAEGMGRWTQRFGKGKVVDAKVVKHDGSVTEEVDRVLDKIIREGFQSLTKEERRILEEGSEYISRRVNRR